MVTFADETFPGGTVAFYCATFFGGKVSFWRTPGAGEHADEPDRRFEASALHAAHQCPDVRVGKALPAMLHAEILV